MQLSQQLSLLAFVVILVASSALGDPNDWVNVDYVISQAKDRSNGLHSSTTDAQASIIRNADSSASKGPWSVVNSKNVLPPSQSPHDYLSWAPYHWPDCDWCSTTGRTHLVHTGDGSGLNNSDSGDGPDSDADDPYSDSEVSQSFLVFTDKDLISTRTTISNSQAIPTMEEGTFPVPTNAPTTTALLEPLIPSSSLTVTTSGAKSAGPAQAVAKPTKASCTPSPTKSLAPSATWTTCNYVSRDGQVNLDVRTLNGPDAVNAVAQAVLYNSVAYALQKSLKYSKNVANFLEVFFLNASTKMNPNVDFGQIVRGPGESGRTGTFTGILDLRGVVKIINGVSIVKAASSPDWYKDNDKALQSWFFAYDTWLTSSDIGRKAGSRPNNHATFYTSQTVAAKFFSGDQKGAIVDLQKFCSTTFLDQVAKTGEQPFEAVRTRPFHYRCFNLEALITNAKLGDQMGVDLWSCKSKYGATIQTALDFLMATNPGSEDKSQLYPHVASISAAYGDPTGKYAAFLKDREPSYQSKPYWFYDQTMALSTAPASRKKTRSVIWRREIPLLVSSVDHPAESIPASGVNVPFECPAVFQDAIAVEIDDGIYVTCDELRSLYEDGV